jgi:hypothetical protein
MLDDDDDDGSEPLKGYCQCLSTMTDPHHTHVLGDARL